MVRALTSQADVAGCSLERQRGSSAFSGQELTTCLLVTTHVHDGACNDELGRQQLSAAGEAFGQKPRELAPRQVLAIGGLAGALASIVATPADVVKTRIMTASSSQAVSSGAWLLVCCHGRAHSSLCSCQPEVYGDPHQFSNDLAARSFYGSPTACLLAIFEFEPATWPQKHLRAKCYAGRIISQILKTEGVGALFKGALPRACWVAPLGAMNFAGYELAKNALKERSSEASVPLGAEVGSGGNQALTA